MSTRVPEEYAIELLRHVGVGKVIDVRLFAGGLGLKVREVPSESFDGALIRIPRKLRGVVAVRESIREAGRKIFTIAHEIGHFILPGHGTPECFCTAKDLNSWQAHVSCQHETAANRFASELLLPSHLLHQIVNRRKASLELAKEVADDYSTSLTAAAIKCVDVTDEACALVWSVDGQIEWAHKNDAFWPFIPKGRLDRNSYAGRLFSDHSRPTGEGELNAGVWLNLEDGRDRLPLWEDSLHLPHYNAVLSILTIEF